MAKFTVYKRKDGDWGWRLRATGNNEIVAVSGEGFKELDDVEHSIKLVKEQAPNAPIAWADQG
jgi:uncharacterized protein YegP (UPF0339 family)